MQKTSIKKRLVGTLTLSLFLALGSIDHGFAKKEQPNIEVSIQKKVGKWQVNANMTVDLSTKEFIELLDSTPENCEWMHDCISVTLLNEPDHLNREIATLFKSPWPFSDRLMLTKSKIEFTEDKSQVKVYVSALAPTPEQLRNDEVVLIKETEGIWFLRETGDLSELSYIGSADADVAMPAFILKRTLLTSTTKTFENIHKKSKALTDAKK